MRSSRSASRFERFLFIEWGTVGIAIAVFEAQIGFDVPRIWEIGWHGRHNQPAWLRFTVLAKMETEDSEDRLAAALAETVRLQVLRQVKARYVLGLTATRFCKDGHHPIILMQCGFMPIFSQLG